MAFNPTLVSNTQKIKLTLGSSEITADQIGFPLTVILDGANPLHASLFADLGDNSKKISIESGTTQLPVEIESWDSVNGKATLHTKVPTYSASADSELVLSYDSAQADNVNVGNTGDAIAQSVWDNNFKVVYHMAQDPSIGGACILDSTSNVNHGVPTGMTSSNMTTNSEGRRGLIFDGVDDKVQLPGTSFLNGVTAFSLEAWCSTPGDDQYSTIVGFRGTEYAWLAYYPSTDPSGELVEFRYLSGRTFMSTIIHDQDQYYAGTWDNSGDTIAYFDGDEEDSSIGATSTLSVNDYWYLGFDDFNSARLYKGDMYEVRISDIVRSADWIKLTNLSLTDQLIIWSAYETGAALLSILEQQYDLLADVVQAYLDQQYGITLEATLTLEQLYSMVLETWVTQYYGSVSWLTKSLSQPYRSASILQKNIVQRWGDALEMEIDLDQPWSMPDLLQLINEQSYGIVAEVIHKTSEQLYNINQLSTLFASSHQAYAIAGEVANVYRYDTKLYIDGERIPYTALSWESSENDYYWSAEAVVATKELASKAVSGAEMRIEWAGESLCLKCYDGWMLTKSFGSTSYRITGAGKSKDLSLEGTISGDIDGGMASDICANFGAIAGVTVDWQMDDGYIASGKLVANDETPLDLIRKIVWDCKGKLRSTLDGNLIAAYEEEVSVSDYPSVTPADTIVARIERISTSESVDEQYGYNSFSVSDQLASGDSRNLVNDLIDSRTAELREYATPLYTGIDFELTHRGPATVSIEPFGVVSEEVVDELVKFESGSGQASLPMYAITSKTWQTESLGAVSFAEDGLLESEISGYGLLKISYITKYFKWIARHPSIADVLFVADEISEESI